MKRNILKSFCFSITLISLFAASFIPVNALSTETKEGTEVICDENGNELNTSIDDINCLIDKQNYSYMNNDMNKVSNLENNLKNLGVKEKSAYELSRELGEEAFGNLSKLRGASFKTVYSTYTVGGKTYNVMRVLVTPTTSSNLYQTGVTALKNSSSAKANAMSFVGIAAKTVLGEVQGPSYAIKVYDAFEGISSAFSSTVTISNIQSSYTWNTAETCSFVYFKTPNGIWYHAASYSKVNATVTVVTPTLNYGSSGAITSQLTRQYNPSFTPTNYDSVAKAFSNGYNISSIYVSQRISSIPLTGIEGKTVKNISLLCPYSTTSIN